MLMKSKRLLMMTEEGTEEIISTRSKIFQELGVNIDELSTGTLIKLVAKYPVVTATDHDG